MCGIGGFYAPKLSAETRYHLLRRLLVNASSRGTDAAGVAFIDPETKKMVVVKNGESAADFVKSKEFLALRDRIPEIAIAHARAASGRGAHMHNTKADGHPSDNNNNHPFYSEHSGLALIHNGLMADDDEWRETVGQERGLIHPCTGTTDSEVMLRIMESLHLRNPEKPMLKVIEDATFNVAGTYSLAILKESEPGKLWLVRHSQELSIAYLPESQSIVFGSTQKIIESSVSLRKSYMHYFWEENLPKIVNNQVSDDDAVEIGTDEKGKGYIMTQGLEPAKSDYSYHKAFCAKQEKSSQRDEISEDDPKAPATDNDNVNSEEDAAESEGMSVPGVMH